MRAAFEFLEAAVATEKDCISMASRPGMDSRATDRARMSLARRALAAGARSRRRRASFSRDPVSLQPRDAGSGHPLESGPAGNRKARRCPSRGRDGHGVCASASLLQGRLAKGLPEILGETFPNFSSDAQRSIQFVRSTPGVNVALVGMKSVEHVRDTLAAASHPPASVDELMKLFRPSDERK